MVIEGDVGEENIGISETDKITILNEVSIVFHNAALLKMDATLSQAINVNTKGVIRMLNIAMEMKNLDVSFVYFSSLFFREILCIIQMLLQNIRRKNRKTLNQFFKLVRFEN